MSSRKELYDKLLKEAKQYFANKKYQEACESAFQLFDVGRVKINEDRLFAGRVLLKGGQIEEAWKVLRYFPTNYEATPGEKLLLEVIKDAKFIKEAHYLTARIFRNALKEFEDGSLTCDVAISKLDLLPDTLPVICFLSAAFVGYATLLDPPFVWDGCERFMFIEKLMDLIYREAIPSDYFADAMNALASMRPFLLDWSSNIPDGSIFMAIFDQARKPKDISSSTLAEDAGTSSSTPTTVSSIIAHRYEDLSSLPRYCFNVYSHFSERKYQHYPERQHKDISKVGIEKYIRRMFPWIYTAILEALLSGSPDFHAEWPRNARDEAFTTLLSYSPFAKDAQMVLEDMDGFIFPRRG